nr:transposase (putative), gypsy type [Tanacetum cinerariifolium]
MIEAFVSHIEMGKVLGYDMEGTKNDLKKFIDSIGASQGTQPGVFASKPEQRITHVSLPSGVIPGRSSGVRVLFLCFLKFCYLPSGSINMSLWHFDEIEIPDTVDHVAEATVLQKFDMHLYTSSMDETYVNGIQRLTTFRHNDSSVADPSPSPWEFDASEAERLCEVVITFHKQHPSLLYAADLPASWKHEGHISFLRDSEGKGCKIMTGDPLSDGATRVTHTTPPAARLEDIPPEIGAMEAANQLCQKVLAEKEKKRRKVEVKAASEADAPEKAKKAARKKRASREGPSQKKKKKTRPETPSTVNMNF